MNRQERIFSIDFLRGIAVLMVILHHLRLAVEFESGRIPFSNVNGAIATPIWMTRNFFYKGGWIGVDLFFVLSGFLISGLIFREYNETGDFRIKNFFIRRGLRIYPPLWFLLVTTFLADWIIHRPIPIRNIIGEVFFLQNYIGNMWGQNWSLAIEEHFYLLLAIASFMLVRRRTKNTFSPIRPLFIVIATSCMLLRFISCTKVIMPPYHTQWATHYRMDSLLFGVVINYYYTYHFDQLQEFIRSHRNILWIGVVGVIMPQFLNPNGTAGDFYTNTVGFTMLYLACGALLLLLLFSDKAIEKGGVNRAISYIGRHSYSIYLWHIVILDQTALLFRYTTWSYIWYAFLSIGGALGLGIIMSKLVEIPSMRLRERFFPFVGTKIPLQNQEESYKPN